MNRLLALLLILAACSSAPRPSGAPKGLVDAAPLRTDWTPEQLQASCAEAEKTSDAKLAEVVGIPGPQRTFVNTPEAIEQVTADGGGAVSRADFMKNIHVDEKVRAAAAACEGGAGKYAARLASRKDLYLAIGAWQGKKEPVGPQQARLVEIAMRDFHRAGVDLPEEKRAELVKLRERIAELQTRFSTNLAEDTTSIEMAPGELEGMPESYLSRLKKGEGGKFIVTTKYPDYFPFMENARRTEARRKLETAFMNRGAKHNLQLLDEAIALRDQAPRLLGYPTHAAYVTEIQMAKNARTVREFHADLLPRPGKDGPAAAFPLTPGRELRGGYQVPPPVLVVNFTPPQGGEPAHLTLNEVETLFHEFGHVMHSSLTTAQYATLSGTNVATDFVEAPSQMLENWVYRPEVLKLLSSGPDGEPLPPELMQRIAKARKFDAGVKYSRQVFLGQFDLYIHTHGAKVDSDASARRLWEEIMAFPEDPQAHLAAGFGHMMGGYDAGYYGYLWSEVFAADLFTRFAREGVLNPNTGRV